ncbi:MAG: O-succinylbenzoate--CoA ligase [Frankiales bacterium]|nr:O-succinylbenzoate--CoA ligase [Frankiales bacterium]
MDRQQLLPHLIRARALAEPNRVYIQEVGGRECSYGDFYDLTLSWANAFDRLGVRPGDRVLSITANNIESYLCWIGLSWLPAVNVAINDEYRGQLLIHTINTSGASVIVAHAADLTPVISELAALPHLRTMVVLDEDHPAPLDGLRVIGRSEFFAEARPISYPGPNSSDAYGITFTSGTTGRSKGVLGTWGQLSCALEGTFPAEQVGRYPGGGYYSPWRSSHLSSRAVIDVATRAGLRLVLRDGLSVSNFWNDLRAYDCTHALLLFTAPWIWAQPTQANDDDNPLRRLCIVPLVPEFRDFERRFDVEVCTSWGSSEAAWPLAIEKPENHRSCGRRVDGFELRVVDTNGADVTNGEAGELLVRAVDPDQRFAGYVDLPEATASVMTDDWYHTGDSFLRDDAGNYFFVDRIKDYIKRRGQGISAFEVETYVQAHPDVRDCAGIGVKSDSAATDVLGDEEVKIVVERVPGALLQESELARFLQASMPRFMIPRYIEFVDLIPRNHVNKVVKVELRKQGLTATTWDSRTAEYVLIQDRTATSTEPLAAADGAGH